MTTEPNGTSMALAVPDDDPIGAKLANTSIALADHWKVAQLLARSHYFQDATEAPKAFTKILAGAELGFGPIASMRGIYIVKGQVTYAANLIAAAIQKSGRYRYRVDKLDRSGCHMTFFERLGDKWEPLGTSEFTEADAVAAGLNGGDNWKHFPRNMHFARCLTNGARWYCPDVFSGPVYTPDEMGAPVDDDGQAISIPDAPPSDTAAMQRNAKHYDAIFKSEEDRSESGPAPLPDSESLGRAGTDASPAPESARRPTRAELWAENRALVQKASDLGIAGPPDVTRASNTTADVLAQANAELASRIKHKEDALVQDAAF